MDTPQPAAPAVEPGQAEIVISTPTQQQQAPQQTPPPANPQATPPAQTPQSPNPEEIAALRERAARAEQVEKNYRELQGAYTRSQQALKAYVGAPPAPPTPQDVLAPYVQKLVSQGYDEKDARALAGTIQEFVQPIQQQFGAGLAAAQAQAQIPLVMQQAYGQAQALFADPWIQNEVQNALLEAAQTNPGAVTPAYAISYAMIRDGERRYFPQQNGNQQPMQPQQPVNFRSQTGITNNFNGHQPNVVSQPGQLPPHLAEAQKATAEEVRRRHNLPPLQS